MNVPADQIAYKRRIGTIDNDPLWEVGLKGGLHLVIAARNGKAETLGVGPHRAIARHIAKKREPKIQLTELSKSDWCPEEAYAHLLPKYEEITTSPRKFLEALGVLPKE